MSRTCQFYAVGEVVDGSIRFEAYDEYDAYGSGLYYTDDWLMIERLNMGDGVSRAREHSMDLYLVTITISAEGHHVISYEPMLDRNEVKKSRPWEATNES
jgi:hypothetical protein